MWSILREERGSVAVITALAFTALLGFAALVMDVGVMYFHKAEAVNISDSAVLAGVQELPDTAKAQSVGLDYAERNGRAGDNIGISFTNNDKHITADVSRKVTLFFARVFNVFNADVGATATAAVFPIKSHTGVVPLGVVKQEFVYGTTYTLKVGGGDGTTGNYGALALGGKGASNYEDNIKLGYDGNLRAGDWVVTETGNMSGPTQSGINYRVSQDPTATYETASKNSPRIVILPVLDSFTVNGRNEVLIVGFAAFFLEGAGASGKDCIVTGKFMKMYIPDGEISDDGTEYGVYGTRLIK